MNQNNKNGAKIIEYKGYTYYYDNPALTVFETIKEILKDCGIIKTEPLE